MKHAREDYDRIQDPDNLIPEDEPVFLIRAKDVAAPEAVKAWAKIAKQYGAKDNIIEAALIQAEKMKQWQLDKEVQVPDMP